jgi:hypothetical protein
VLKLQKVLLAVACLAAAAAIGGFLLHQPDPTFKGKPLAYWARQYWGEPTPDQQAEAIQAITALCTNAIPELVAAIAYDPNPRARVVAAVVGGAPRPLGNWLFYNFGYDRKSLRTTDAVSALQALGPLAAPALPGLIKLTENPNLAIAAQALLALSRMGTNGLPALLYAATNTAYPYRVQALGRLSGMNYLGTNASPAIPALVLSCQEANPPLAIAAARALGDLAICPDLTVPVLTALLTNSTADVQAQAVKSLGRFGSDARPAVPALLSILRQGPTKPLTTDLILALSDIAPEVLTNAPVRRW